MQQYIVPILFLFLSLIVRFSTIHARTVDVTNTRTRVENTVQTQSNSGGNDGYGSAEVQTGDSEATSVVTNVVNTSVINTCCKTPTITPTGTPDPTSPPSNGGGDGGSGNGGGGGIGGGTVNTTGAVAVPQGEVLGLSSTSGNTSLRYITQIIGGLCLLSAGALEALRRVQNA